MQPRWIELEGLANLRDVGGTPTTDGGAIADGVLLRSDNLQTLSESDVARLRELHLTDVIDLRSDIEVQAEGPGPMMRADGVAVHHHSLFREDESSRDLEHLAANTAKALPWVELTPTVSMEHPTASIYLSYLVDRPDSVLASLREIGAAEGAVLVHCAAGKDRTGTIIALALLLAGADPDAVTADYAASTERAQAILDRLLASPTYADNLRDRPIESHYSHPETMRAFLDYIEQQHGSVQQMLAGMGWTEEDTSRIRAKLRPDLG